MGRLAKPSYRQGSGDVEFSKEGLSGLSDLVRSIIEPATKRLSSSLGVNASVNGEFVVWNVDNEYGPQFSVRYNENLFRLSFLEFGLVYPVPSPWSEEMFIEVVEDILAIAEMCTKGEYLVGRRKRWFFPSYNFLILDFLDGRYVEIPEVDALFPTSIVRL